MIVVLGRDTLELSTAAVLVALGVSGLFYADFYGQEVLAEIAIFAIMAMSLDLLVGYVGMVSLGHAAFLAAGAYAIAALTVFFDWPASVSMVAAVAIAAALAALVGVFAVRLGGVFFIMITLAIGQMFHAYFFKARAFGSNDGMSGIPRVDLSAAGLDANEPVTFAALTLVVAVGTYAVLRILVRSPFGAMLIAIHQNEARVRALGCPVARYKLAIFVVAGGVAGLAGALAAQHSGFVSPDLGFWTVSGEVLIMVIVGGMGSLVGAAAGAAILVLLRHTLSDAAFWSGVGLPGSMAEFWQLIMGLFFVAVVLFADDGLIGRLRRAASRLRALRGARTG